MVGSILHTGVTWQGPDLVWGGGWCALSNPNLAAGVGGGEGCTEDRECLGSDLDVWWEGGGWCSLDPRYGVGGGH